MAHVASDPVECYTAAPDVGTSSEVTRKRRRTEKSRVGAAYPRKRAVAACRSCRARKIKCNNGRPACGGCLSAASTCVYEDSQDHSAFDPASILILDRLDQVLARLDQSPACPNIPSGVTRPSAPESNPRVSATSATPGEEHEAYDQLRIPSSQTTPDAILSWPVFQHQFPATFTTDPVFAAEVADEELEEESSSQSHKHIYSKIGGIDEDSIPDLVQRFLRYVHIKNPVVDMDTIVSYARTVSEDGIKWDTMSCLVLLACALGCVAQPFHDPPSRSQHTSLECEGKLLQNGEAYYNCARKRFGLLKAGISATQCHFLAGMYLMYTMQPLSAWSSFRSASTSYHVYLDFKCRRLSHSGTGPSSPKRRRLEQSLYWSCYKSECELRMEINLPDSCLANIQYPDLHPLPPCTDTPSPAAERLNAESRPSRPTGNVFDIQQQETSWFYYLTEITLRRIRNSVLNTLYVRDYKDWTDDQIPYMALAAVEFEQQLQEWYAGLPAPISYKNDEMPAEELPWLVRGRELEIRIQIYQPFLYYAIHQLGNSSCRSLVLPLAEKALVNCFYIIKGIPTKHRHHGSWFGIRFNVSASLLLLAAVKSETLSIRPDWQDLVYSNIDTLRYWKDEAPGLSEAIQVLQYYCQR